jgi:hypothetical protein
MKRIILLVIFAGVLGSVTEAWARGTKLNRKYKRPNAPPGWSWPPNQRMKDEGAACLKQLDALGVKWQAGKALKRIATPIEVPSMTFGGVLFSSMWRKPPFVMDCHLALALETSLGPALRSINVKEVKFFGFYDYRNVAGTRTLSRHALGLAIDMGAFITDDGVEHVVKRDYRKKDSVLFASEDLLNATNAFRILLTPGNDPKAHWDHFHIEARTPADVPNGKAVPSENKDDEKKKTRPKKVSRARYSRATM